MIANGEFANSLAIRDSQTNLANCIGAVAKYCLRDRKEGNTCIPGLVFDHVEGDFGIFKCLYSRTSCNNLGVVDETSIPVKSVYPLFPTVSIWKRPLKNVP